MIFICESYKDKDRQTDTDRQTDRHGQTDQNRQTDRQRHRLACWFKCQTFLYYKWSMVVFMSIELGSQRQISVGNANDKQFTSPKSPNLREFP